MRLTPALGVAVVSITHRYIIWGAPGRLYLKLWDWLGGSPSMRSTSNPLEGGLFVPRVPV